MISVLQRRLVLPFQHSWATFIRTGDARIKRVKQAGGTYSYYLTKNEQNIPIESVIQPAETEILRKEKGNIYAERDLHILVSRNIRS
jgi:uncharacterized protein